jgi:anti-sigma B factor antagonist
VLFHLHTSEQGGWSVVAVGGDLDLTTSPRLRKEIVALVSWGTTRVVLDLGGIEFCDSVGLGVIVAAVKRVRSHGGELRLANCSPPVLRLLELTRLDRALPPYPDVAAALADPVEG